MDIFLRAKHWQLFLLTFGIPMLLQIVMIFSVFLNFGHPNDAAIFTNLFGVVDVTMALFMGVLLGWQWSVAMGLQKCLPTEIKMKTTRFKIFFFIPVIYLTVIALLVFIAFSHISSTELPGSVFFIVFACILPIHLFAMFCIFYCLYFVAKTIKTVELQREVSFSDFTGEFFLAWFFPVGVWILQPKINKFRAEYPISVLNGGNI
ncbi:MAG: hypothetical protein NVS3B13_33090 [Mucilaginibacter sp.]